MTLMEGIENMHVDFESSDSPFPKLTSPGVESLPQLRPKCFEEYPGQDRVVQNLKVYTESAKKRGKMLDHCLFHGPPGLGKTTLAGIMAEVMGCELVTTSGPNIEKPRDLMGLLASLEKSTILFIDEIHRLPIHVEEVLYTAMEDGKLDLLIGDGPTARSVRFELRPFTLIGATTRPGSLSAPLRNRFGITEHLEYYKAKDLVKIIQRSCLVMGIKMEEKACLSLAERVRGTPRIANVLLKRVMDFAVVADESIVTEKTVNVALSRLGIDPKGLSRADRRFLKIMKDRYEGGPVGLESIASALNEERSTLEDVYEPYLVYQGFLSRTPRGRILTDLARSHLENEWIAALDGADEV